MNSMIPSSPETRKRDIAVELKTGTVRQVAMDSRRYVVELDDGVMLNGCVSAIGGIFAPLLGFRFASLMEVGTRVAIMTGRTPFILSALPSSRIDPSGSSQDQVAAGRLDATDEAQPDFQSVPRDMIEGEFSIANALGVGIDFLTSMVRLRGGRAAIEVGLRDDIIRMVAERFQVFSAGSASDEFNDGRLNQRSSATSYPHEAYGQLEPDAAKAAFIGKGLIAAPDAAELLRTGRWRYDRFRGFVGDFVNTWITEPETVLGSLAYGAGEGGARRSGHSRHWEGADGTLLWQSVAEIAIEKVVRIPVPYTKKVVDGQVDEARIKSLETSFLKLWDPGVDFDKLHQTAFQIREYARYLSLFAGLARFHQQPDIYGVASETQTPAPSPTNKELDREQENPGLAFYEIYSTIRILRSGGILLHEGNGGCLLLENGEGWATVPKHWNFEAGGDMRFTAGRDIWFKARRNISISSTFGGIFTKARTAFQVLCERGSVWLKSDASAADGAPGADGVDKPEAVKLESGVLIESPRWGTTITSGAGRVLIEARGSTSGGGDNGSVVVQSALGGIRLRASQTIGLASQSGAVFINAAREFYVRAIAADWDLRAMKFWIKNMLRFNGGQLQVGQITTRFVRTTSGISGPSQYVSRTTSNPEPDLPDENPPASVEAVLDPSTTLSATFNDDRPVWRFPVAAEADLYESLSQQTLRREVIADAAEYGSWNEKTDDVLLNATGTDNASSPFPQGRSHKVHVSGGHPLNAPCAADPKTLAPNPQELQLQDTPTKFRKFPTS